MKGRGNMVNYMEQEGCLLNLAGVGVLIILWMTWLRSKYNLMIRLKEQNQEW